MRTIITDSEGIFINKPEDIMWAEEINIKLDNEFAYTILKECLGRFKNAFIFNALKLPTHLITTLDIEPEIDKSFLTKENYSIPGACVHALPEANHVAVDKLGKTVVERIVSEEIQYRLQKLKISLDSKYSWCAIELIRPTLDIKTYMALYCVLVGDFIKWGTKLRGYTTCGLDDTFFRHRFYLDCFINPPQEVTLTDILNTLHADLKLDIAEHKHNELAVSFRLVLEQFGILAQLKFATYNSSTINNILYEYYNKNNLNCKYMFKLETHITFDICAFESRELWNDFNTFCGLAECGIIDSSKLAEYIPYIITADFYYRMRIDFNHPCPSIHELIDLALEWDYIQTNEYEDLSTLLNSLGVE